MAGDVFDDGLAPAPVGGFAGGRQGTGDTFRRASDHEALEVSFKAGVPLYPELLDQFLRREVAARCVVLVKRMNGDAVGGGAGGLGEGDAEGVMAFVGDADPVDRAEHDRFARTRDHHTTAAQRQVIEALNRVVGHRRTQRRGGVDIERRDLDGGRRDEADGSKEEEEAAHDQRVLTKRLRQRISPPWVWSIIGPLDGSGWARSE